MASSLFRIATLATLAAAAPCVHADCDLRFAPPEVRRAAYRYENGATLPARSEPLDAPTNSPFEKGGPKGDLLFGPGRQKQILPDPPGLQAQPAGVR